MCSREVESHKDPLSHTLMSSVSTAEDVLTRATTNARTIRWKQLVAQRSRIASVHTGQYVDLSVPLS